MNKELIFPCTNCVVLASCKARFKGFKEEDTYRNLNRPRVFIIILLRHCSLLYDYIYNGDHSTEAYFDPDNLATAGRFYEVDHE